MIAPSTATVGIARTPHALPSSHICWGGQRRSVTSQPHEATASFTNRNVSSQSEQPALKTSIFLFPAIPIHLLLICFAGYIPVQQHLSSVLPVSLQRNFPSFCVSQQHFFTSLPVKLQTIFGEAADAIVATVSAAKSGSHFVSRFIISPPSVWLPSFSTPSSHVQGQALKSDFYSAQQESFAGSLRREMATIFSASAIVG